MNVQALKYFRRNLRVAMERRELSQRDIADAAGISYPYVNRILTDKVEPTLPICDRLADAVKLPLSRLLVRPSEFDEADLQTVSR